MEVEGVCHDCSVFGPTPGGRRPVVTYPSGLDLVDVQREEELGHPVQVNPVAVQTERSHSVLKHRHDTS